MFDLFDAAQARKARHRLARLGVERMKKRLSRGRYGNGRDPAQVSTQNWLCSARMLNWIWIAVRAKHVGTEAETVEAALKA